MRNCVPCFPNTTLSAPPAKTVGAFQYFKGINIVRKRLSKQICPSNWPYRLLCIRSRQFAVNQPINRFWQSENRNDSRGTSESISELKSSCPSCSSMFIHFVRKLMHVLFPPSPLLPLGRSVGRGLRSCVPCFRNTTFSAPPAKTVGAFQYFKRD